jgi:cytochrome c5
LSSEESKHDQQFYDQFLIILGILISVTVLLFVLARWIGVGAQDANMQADPMHQIAVDGRLEPVARVAIAGQDFVEESGETMEAQAVREMMTGPQVYNAICGSCHGTGLAGAPMTGDKAAWSARVAQGQDTLNDHALNGFQGGAGYMPAKGGRVDLSDEEIIASVQYMLDELK